MLYTIANCVVAAFEPCSFLGMGPIWQSIFSLCLPFPLLSKVLHTFQSLPTPQVLSAALKSLLLDDVVDVVVSAEPDSMIGAACVSLALPPSEVCFCREEARCILFNGM